MKTAAVKTLAIDTSLAAGSVAALSDGRIAARPLPTAGEHARRLAAALAEVAAEIGWRPRDAEMIAVVRGPGSFTSLRVGVSTAKAIAWTTGARLLGVSGFEVIARQAARFVGPGSIRVEIAYDAGRGEVFAATATPDAASPSAWSVGPATLLAANDWIASRPQGAVVSGPALDLLVEACAARADLRVVPGPFRAPSAGEAAAVAALRAAAGEADAPHSLLPDYLRPSYAQENDPRS